MLKVRCQAQATLDVKGRLALPAALRRALDEAGVRSLVLTVKGEAIWGWEPETFERVVEAPLAQADPFAAEVNDFVHAVVAPAQDVEVDGQGRIRIPGPLREQVGLEREVVINSLLDRIEIWDRARWEDRFREALARSSGRPGMPGRTP